MEILVIERRFGQETSPQTGREKKMRETPFVWQHWLSYKWLPKTQLWEARVRCRGLPKKRLQKQGNVVHCGPAVFVCFENKHLAISITLMALSVTMDFAPCSNALRFTALCVHFVLFPMGFTSPCANQRKKTLGSQQYVRIVLHT